MGPESQPHGCFLFNPRNGLRTLLAASMGGGKRCRIWTFVSDNLLPRNCRLHRLDARGDERGNLIALECGLSVPFDIRRVYYIFGTKPGVDRGFHAHRRLQQMAICVSGSCSVLVDDGRERREIVLDDPGIALEIGPMVWREMRRFSESAVLVVLADAIYDEADYIRDYDDFLALAAAA